MNKISLFLLCSSAFLYACDSSNDTAEKAAAEKEMDESTVAMDETMDTAVEAATDDTSATEPAVAVTSQADVAATDAASAAATTAVDGESIYKTKCIACHGAGVAGAPKLGDKAVWAPRIAQGNAVLTQHAIEGFKGETGVMPAKGGFANLSDEEISATVEYMVSQSK